MGCFCKKYPIAYSTTVDESVEGATDSNDILNNGGLANANYAKLQYDGLTNDEKLKLKNALLRYCELDTMAMVLIYEFFKIHSK